MTAVSDLVAALIASGLLARSIQDLLTVGAEALRGAGIPVWRTHVSFPTINPQVRATNNVWLEDVGATSDSVGHDDFGDAFDRSPFPGMLSRNERFRRWRFCDGDDPGNFDKLCAMRDAGATDVLVFLVDFGRGSGGILQGAALSFATRQPDGFDAAQETILRSVVHPLALGAFRIILTGVTEELLGAYIGRDACRRVLAGEIRRGRGLTVEGAILFADLSGFTAASEAGGPAIVERLDEHLEAIAAPIEEAGGEVLKFLGDGLLAGFAIDEAPDDGCRSAVGAAIEAVARTRAVNARYPGGQPLGLKVALHRGEVFYGNVGGGSRLDFTVLGPAVNEASRMEKLCGALGRTVLMSAPVASCCGRETVSLGLHTLRGVAEPRELFGLAAERASPPAEGP